MIKKLEDLENFEKPLYATYFDKSSGRVHIGEFMSISNGKAVFDREGEPHMIGDSLCFNCVQLWDWIDEPRFILGLWRQI